jgi:hypothetical protein
MIKTLATFSIAAAIVSATAAFAAPARHIVHGQANVNTNFRYSAHSEYPARPYSQNRYQRGASAYSMGRSPGDT